MLFSLLGLLFLYLSLGWFILFFMVISPERPLCPPTGNLALPLEEALLGIYRRLPGHSQTPPRFIFLPTHVTFLTDAPMKFHKD